ncbi:MAG: DUF998 domain-containing protein [Actinomycetales bacterium]|nr:DUF998 domain-containing protein [Actinomycetales bacterium]
MSELTSPGAPFRGLLGAGFALYNLGVVAVGVGVLLRGPRRIPEVIGAGALAACGVAGVLMIEPFPQDPMGSPLTPAGTVHIALAGVSALGLVLALVLFAVAWWRDAFWRRLRVISVVCAAAILVTGGVGAAMVASPVFGLFERFTQVSFLTWFAVLGVFALRAARGERPGSAHSATAPRG